jgi:hypothetical protein
MARVSDQEIIDALAVALVGHPSWAEPQRINVFALSKEDAELALVQTYGDQIQVLTLLFRADVVDAIMAAGQKQGFWVSSKDGQEMFFESKSESEAMTMFKAKSGVEAVSCVGTRLVEEELARMDQELSAENPSHVASVAFLAKVAAGEMEN